MTKLSEKTPVYFGGIKKFGGLSGSVLKVIAITVMVIDHTSVVFVGQDLNIWRTIGRLGFPIFAFFIAEGAGRTKNIYKYMLRLAAFALVSEIPFDLAFNGTWFYPEYQNVFFTLLMGLMAIWAFMMLDKVKLGWLSPLTTAVLAAGAYFLNTDYDATGVAAIFLFYIVMRLPKLPRAIGIVAVCFGLTLLIYNGIPAYNSAEEFAVFASIPLLLYNGKKGFKMNKYFFYAFYPGHILLLWLISLFIK